MSEVRLITAESWTGRAANLLYRDRGAEGATYSASIIDLITAAGKCERAAGNCERPELEGIEVSAGMTVFNTTFPVFRGVEINRLLVLVVGPGTPSAGLDC